MSLAISLLLFVAFVANVVVGKVTGSPFVGDVGEMLILLAASAAFVVAILRKEASRRNKGG